MLKNEIHRRGGERAEKKRVPLRAARRGECSLDPDDRLTTNLADSTTLVVRGSRNMSGSFHGLRLRTRPLVILNKVKDLFTIRPLKKG
jgi:hypothetical protein